MLWIIIGLLVAVRLLDWITPDSGRILSCATLNRHNRGLRSASERVLKFSQSKMVNGVQTEKNQRTKS